MTPFLAACRGEPVPYTPVWFMRQAGRSLPEYRELRGEGSILEAIRRPELATEITLQPVRRYGVDAAILFSDIVVPVTGFGVDVVPGTGPVVAQPFRSRADLDRLRPEPVPYVEDTVRLLVKELGATPLIGFAGGPFTLASYLVEGGPSQGYALTKTLMWSEPQLWADLVGRLAEITLSSLQAQVTAGASAVQIFESWGGALSPGDYRTYVMPALRRVLGGLVQLGVPRIVFGVNTGELMATFAECGADVVGVDWRVPLSVASERAGAAKALQGNLDPTACLAPWPVLATKARDVLAGAPATGHIFNLGHGVLPATDPSQLERLVDLVHTETLDRPGAAPQLDQAQLEQAQLEQPQ
ncbi:MAG TPA: uroporphyrinogen decarboxylase [Acidimicrobiales bacterium]|nr:uroporphyrinogen decarboxylase [Acidimicrobiales bacterium]